MPLYYMFGGRNPYIVNVKEYGATGNGSTDDTAAIQAAVNWTTSPNRGTIYFPLGKYLVSSPITFNGVSINDNLSIRFLGEGAGSAIVSGFNGYTFDRNSVTPNNTTGIRIFEKLNISNTGATGGCIRLGSTLGGFIRDCVISGHISVTAEDSVGVSSQNILIENCAITSQGNATGSHGIILGGSGAILGCDVRNVDTGVRIYGNGVQISGCRCENTNTGHIFGLDSGGNNVGASGFAVTGVTYEGNGTSVYLAGGCSGFVIGPISITGHNASNSGYPLGIQDTQYGIRIDTNCAQAGVINGVGCGSQYDVAGISIANATSRANVVLTGCNSLQTGSSIGVSWIPPTNAQTGIFMNNNTQPVWTFSQLPSGANVIEGDEFDISDSPTATWGANVTVGGGANHVRVRYNGTNWTVMGV